MANFTLYDLAESYQQLLDYIDGHDENEDHFADTLAAIEDSIEQKAENITRLIKSMESEITMLKTERDRLDARINSRTNKVKHLKTYLQQNLELANVRKLKTMFYSVWIQANPESLDIDDETKIPAAFRIPQPDKIDKRSLLAHIKAGNEIDGATIKQNEGIRIR